MLLGSFNFHSIHVGLRVKDSERVSETSLSDYSSLAWPSMVFSAADNASRSSHFSHSISAKAVTPRSETSPYATLEAVFESFIQ